MKSKKPHVQFGVTSMGEKGQVVIPADIREELSFKKGEKLMVIAKNGSVTLMPASRFEEMTRRLSAFKDLFTETN
ncbi:MAG: hypothetical protein JWL82_482 [Parcubacteria group bacterium]|nr:hypothetical protein [Parcubacteria group bacterium]